MFISYSFFTGKTIHKSLSRSFSKLQSFQDNLMSWIFKDLAQAHLNFLRITTKHIFSDHLPISKKKIILKII